MFRKTLIAKIHKQTKLDAVVLEPMVETDKTIDEETAIMFTKDKGIIIPIIGN